MEAAEPFLGWASGSVDSSDYLNVVIGKWLNFPGIKFLEDPIVTDASGRAFLIRGLALAIGSDLGFTVSS